MHVSTPFIYRKRAGYYPGPFIMDVIRIEFSLGGITSAVKQFGICRFAQLNLLKSIESIYSAVLSNEP